MRLMIFDDTCRGRRLRPGLTHSWVVGGHLYRALGRIDAFAGFSNWSSAFDWIIDQVDREGEPFRELQFWGHGKWGRALIADEVLDISALHPEHLLYPKLKAIAHRSDPRHCLWWFRTCETFGGDCGLRLAEDWSKFFGATTAGHTHIIGPWQSGLHALEPGARANWSPTEGLLAGSRGAPRHAATSGPRHRHTIHCLCGTVPLHTIVRASPQQAACGMSAPE